MASESEKRVTLAAIAEELRDEAARADTEQYYTLDDAAESMREYAERIEAIDSADAWRSLYTPPVGNAAAMRSALKAIWKEVYHYAIEEDKQDFAHLQEVMLEDPPEYKDLRNSLLAIAHLVDAALSAPPRQCDVGTAEEQAQRFHNFCVGNSSGINGMCKPTCPCIDCFDKCQCLTKWAQTPYEAKEKGDCDGE